MSGDVGNLLPLIGPPSKGEVIDSAIYWVTFHKTSNDVQFSISQLHILDILGYGDGEGVYMGGEVA